MVDWIEMIPFRETRNYVQRIMEGVTVYRDRLNGPFRTVPPAVGRS
jgi:soluble lytic murein transglycosylase